MRLLLWLVIFIVIYGSLYPFNFEMIDVAKIAWFDWGSQLQQRTTNGDVLSNFLVFIPVGYLLFVHEKISNISLIKRAIISTLIGFSFAYFLQVAQFFIPSRIPSVGDAFFNLWGLLVGIGLGFIEFQLLKQNPEVASRWYQQYLIPLIILSCAVLYIFFPYFITFEKLDFQQRWTSFLSINRFVWYETLFYFAFWLVCFHLLQFTPWKLIDWYLLVLIVTTTAIIKLLITHNELSINFLFGALVAIFFFTQFKGLNNPKFIIGILLFSFSLKTLLSVKNVANLEINWLPFEYYLHGSLWLNTKIILEHLFVYGATVFFCFQTLQNWKRTLTIGVLFVLLLELMQFALGRGKADITEIIIMSIILFMFFRVSEEKLPSALKVAPKEE